MSDSQKPVGILQLPPELLQIVFRNCPDDIPSLLDVCKYFRAHAEPFFYRSIKQSWTSRFDSKKASIPRLVRTLIARQDLGPHIHHLELRGPKFQRAWKAKKNIACSFNAEDHQKMAAWLKQVLPEKAMQFSKPLARFQMQALVAVLLTVVPNLKSLILDHETGEFMEDNLIGDVLACAPTMGRNPLAKVEKFELLSFEPQQIADEDYTNRISMKVYGAFALPSIRSLTLRDVGLKARHEMPANPSSLMSFNLAGDLDHMIEKVLMSMANLQDFRYDFRTDHSPCDCAKCKVIPSDFNCVNIMNGFRNSHEKLRKLVISTCPPAHEFMGFDAPKPWKFISRLGSFHSFTQLTIIEAPARAMLGMAPQEKPILGVILPPNLLTLHLTGLSWDWDWMWPEPLIMMEITGCIYCAEYFSKPLKHIKLSDAYDWVPQAMFMMRMMTTPKIKVEISTGRLS